MSPVRIELETRLVAREGAELAAVTLTGWGPTRPQHFLGMPEVAEDLSAAIGSAAARARNALAVAPGLAALRPAPAGPPGAPPPPPAGAPDLRPRIGGFWDLGWAADRDPAVAARVETLASRRAWSGDFAIAGAVSLCTAGLALIPRRECAYGVCTDQPVVHPEVAPAFGIVAAASFVAALVIWPYGATGEVVELWNGRHPDRPLELAPPPPDPAGP